LLPSALLFIVSIADRAGNVVATTHPSASSNAVDNNDLSERHADALLVGRPWRDDDAGEWRLRFSRALQERE
jgi:hypothetical protein